jgi:hypothetical protein
MFVGEISKTCGISMRTIRILHLLLHKKFVKMLRSQHILIGSYSRVVQEETMRRIFLTAMSLAFLTMGISSAQSPQSGSKPYRANSHPIATRPILISGRVSGDGRHFSINRDSDSESEWEVSNARALKGHEGSLVTVKCYVDASRNQIQVLSVNRVQSEVR